MGKHRERPRARYKGDGSSCGRADRAELLCGIVTTATDDGTTAERVLSPCRNDDDGRRPRA